MSQQHDILTTLASELIRVLEPLRESFADAENFKGLMYRLGWNANGLPPPYIELSAAVANALEIVEGLADGDVGADDIARLLATIKDLYDRIQNLSVAPPGVNAGVFLAEIGERLFESLLTEYLSRHHAAVYNSFAALDVITLENQPADANKHAHVRIRFKWEEIPKIIQDPLSIVKRIYGWGTAELDSNQLFGQLSALLHGLKLPVNLTSPDNATALAYSGETQLPFTRQIRGLKIPFHYTTIGDKPRELALDLLELPPAGGNLPGLIIQPGIPAEIPLEFRFGDFVTLSIRAGSDIANRFGVLLTPDRGISVKYPFQDGASFPSAGFSVGVDYRPTDSLILLGAPEGIRLEMKGGELGIEIFSQSGEFQVKGFSEIHDLTLVLAAGQGDGFLQNILGGDEIKVNIPLGVDWSSKTGFGFRGSMNFSIALHPHLSLGVIEITQFQLALEVPSGEPKPKINIEATINVNGHLGPLQLVVEEIGLGLYPVFEAGNLGPLDVDIGFKPPNGVGLSLDAGVVVGGGYLYFDFDREEYAGVLELTIAEIVTVKAVGLINTKMPDGSKGFSLLIIITAEFGTGIQLGFGFTLIGLGGLLGLNRTMNLPPLMEGVRTGAINSIMFPDNPVANAPRIISDLRLIFPPYVGKFLIGPMAKLGWGTPTLISVSLGVIIEIPGNIAILGVLKVALPAEEAPLIVIQVNFAGAIEFDKQRLYFFATLFESRVLFLTIEGDMGLLVAWGDDANFVVSVGGFHPRFNPPPLPFPSPRRIAIDILNTPVYRIRSEGYFAVTSNTVQFGSHTELMIDVGVAQVDGHITFDALFQFSPFYFIIEISAGVSLKVFGMGLFSISLQFALEGPTPWRAHGTGSISFLLFDVSADFDVTWGDSQDTTLPPIPVMPLLKAELEKQQNWIAELPAGNNLLVSLRKLSETESSQVLHPLGTLRVSQRAAPLDIRIDKVGSQKPADANQFKLVPTGDLVKVSDADEQFAKAQFINMSDSDKLSQRAFDPLHGGVKLASGAQTLGSAKLAKRKVRYEQIIIDSNFKRFSLRFKLFSFGFFMHFLQGSSISKSALSKNYHSQLDPFSEKLQVKDGGFTVALAENNRAYSTQAMNFSSETLAHQYLQSQVSLHPELHETLHVIPQHEVTAGA